MTSVASATSHKDLELEASNLNNALENVKTRNNDTEHLLKYCEANQEGFCQGIVELGRNG